MSTIPRSQTNKVSLGMKTQVLGENLLPSLKKKVALHSKNPYRAKKRNPLKKVNRPERVLDGFYLLEKSQCEFPHEVIAAKLSNKNLVDAVENDLAYFENLTRLDLSENSIRDIRKLSALKALNRLELQNNGIEDINFEEKDGLENLLDLDLGYNKIRYPTLLNLSIHPKLRILNLMGNELTDLPDDMSGLASIEILNLSCNRLESNSKASMFWASLASLPCLKDLDVSRNLLRGIHTEKLIPGNFNKIERIDFSYNRAENQHNLICTRNFKSLKVLIVTGNPFASLGQHKGLEKEIYMRVGAILINDIVDIPYLKKQKKGKQPIKFTNLYTIPPDDFRKEAKNTFFGVELPQEEMENMEQPERPEEVEESEEENEDDDQAKFFITEDEQKKKRGKPKGEKRYSDVDNQIEEGEYEENEDQEEMKGDEDEPNSADKEEYSGQNNDETDQRELDINLDEIRNLEDFKKIANMLIGDSKDYDQPVELNTAYKLLRQVVKKSAVNEKSLEGQISRSLKTNSKQLLNSKSKHNTVQARMLDVEFLIDELNKKMSASAVNPQGTS